MKKNLEKQNANAIEIQKTLKAMNPEEILKASGFDQVFESLFESQGPGLALKLAEAYAKNNQLEEDNKKLRTELEKVKKLSTTDELTKIPNRHGLRQEGRKMLAYAKRYKQEISVIMLDADHFKKVNDTYGHDMGDETLRTLARIAQEKIREEDLIARYGGEEFVIVLGKCSQEFARQKAEEIRVAIEKEIIQHKEESINLTISLGCHTTIPHDKNDTLDEMIACADQALYQSKHNGRNQVSIYQLLSKEKAILASLEDLNSAETETINAIDPSIKVINPKQVEIDTQDLQPDEIDTIISKIKTALPDKQLQKENTEH